MPGSTVIYVDTLIQLAALSLIMDYLLLWAAAKVAKVKVRPRRLLAGAAVGAVYFALYYLSARGAIPYYGWLRHWPAVLAVSAGMLVMAFAPMPPKRFLQVSGYFYFISVSSGGAGIAAGYAFGWGVGWRLLVSVAAILVTAEIGWGVVQKSVLQRLYQVPLEIRMFGQSSVTTALLDTGNRLRDPTTGAPVAVVEYKAIAHLLPERIGDAVQRMAGGDLTAVNSVFASSDWSSRFRVVPFTALGKENGLLIGFRPDGINVTIDGQTVHLDRAVIGLYDRPLDPDGAYQALIHPEMIQPALGAEGVDPNKVTLSREGESSHAATPT